MFLAWFFLDFNEIFCAAEHLQLLVCIQKVKVHPHSNSFIGSFAVSLEMRPILRVQPFRFSFNFHLWIFTRSDHFLLFSYLAQFYLRHFYVTQEILWDSVNEQISSGIDFLYMFWYVSSDLRFKCFPLLILLGSWFRVKLLFLHLLYLLNI